MADGDMAERSVASWSEREGGGNDILSWVKKAEQQDVQEWPATLQDRVDEVGTEFYLEQRLAADDSSTWLPCKLTAMGKQQGYLVTGLDGEPIGSQGEPVLTNELAVLPLQTILDGFGQSKRIRAADLGKWQDEQLFSERVAQPKAVGGEPIAAGTASSPPHPFTPVRPGPLVLPPKTPSVGSAPADDASASAAPGPGEEPSASAADDAGAPKPVGNWVDHLKPVGSWVDHLLPRTRLLVSCDAVWCSAGMYAMHRQHHFFGTKKF